MRDGLRRYRGRQSFIDAGRGCATVFRTEWNFRIHIGLALLVIIAGFCFKISTAEWIAIILSAGLVFQAEVLNTALEYLADALHPKADRGIGMAKDAAAGAVLIAAVAAAIVGAIIFLPKLWTILSNLM